MVCSVGPRDQTMHVVTDAHSTRATVRCECRSPVGCSAILLLSALCRLLTSDRVITCFLHFAPNPSTLMPPLERSGITRGERACHECRRMKVRCMREGETSCRRCQHMQMQCVIDPPSRRRKRANDSQGGASGSQVLGELQNGHRSMPSTKRYAVRSRARRGPVLTSQEQYGDEWRRSKPKPATSFQQLPGACFKRDSAQ